MGRNASPIKKVFIFLIVNEDICDDYWILLMTNFTTYDLKYEA